jgi:hypothetical protein
MKKIRSNVLIVVVKCCREKKLFGVRFEEKDRDIWYGTWAFSIKESAAQKEHYNKNKISGTIIFDKEYPGCPYCESKGIFLCGNCNKVACYGGHREVVTCPWCDAKLKLSGHIENLNAGRDR